MARLPFLSQKNALPGRMLQEKTNKIIALKTSESGTTLDKTFAAPDSQQSIMRIAITSQNRRSITEHAGKCRKFWIYDVKEKQIIGKHLLELPVDQSLHAQRHGLPSALSDIDVLITGSMGRPLYLRLRELGVLPLIACEEDPDHAVAEFLAGKLLACSPNAPHAHHHDTHHDCEGTP